MLRPAEKPLVAVVRLRKRNEWVLPKGKLDDGETPRAAAEREVMEETGHDVAVHEFLGTLVYETRGGSKVVHYWRMEAEGEAAHELMRDVKAVDWLPLPDAIDRLSRGYERAFLQNVGPIALAAAAHAAPARKARTRPSTPEKRPARKSGATAPVAAPMLAPRSDQPAPPVAQDDDVTVTIDVSAVASAEETRPAVSPSFALEIEPAAAMRTRQQARRNMLQRLRDWLGR